MADNEQKLGDYIDLRTAQEQTDSFAGQVKSLIDLLDQANSIKLSFQGSEKTKDVTAGITALATSTDTLNKKVKETVDQQVKLTQASKETALALVTESKGVRSISDSYADLIKQSVQNKAAKQQLNEQTKALNATLKAGLITEQQFADAMERIKLEEVELNQSNLELNRTLRNMAKEELAVEGSLDSLRAKLNLALQAFDRLSKEDLVGPEGENLKGFIKELTDEISKQEQATGRFQRNVGNYSSATGVLQKAFQDVAARLASLTKDENANETVVAALTKEYDLLNKILNTQEAGFANATQAIRENQKALLDLEQAGMADSEVYQLLLKQTAEMKDQVNDLKSATKALGSDTFVFDGLIQAAQGLAGIYGVAQGAAALFGDENEELQKTFVKLQAAMTIIQGLQAVANSLQKENAAMLLLANIRTRALAVGETLYTYATAAATTATKAFRTALITTGIGALVVALGYAVGLLIEYAESTDTAVKSQEDLNKELDEQTRKLNEAADASEKIRNARDGGANDDRRRLQALEAQEATQKSILDIQQEIRNDELFNLKVRLETVRGDANEELKVREQIADKESEIDAAQLKFTTEMIRDRRKLYSESEKFRLQNQIETNGKIADDETRSLDQRLAALKAGLDKQKDLIQSNLKFQNQDKSLNPFQRLLNIRTAQNEELKAEKDYREKRKAIVTDYDNREREAQLEILKLQFGDRIAANQKIIDSENAGYAERLEALYQSYENRKAVILADRSNDLDNAKLTGSEREAIEKKYLSDINTLNTEFGDKQHEIVTSNQEKINVAIEALLQKRLNIISKQQATAQIALNDLLSSGGINVEDFARKRAEIDKKYSEESLRVEIANAFAKVFATKEGTNARYEAEKELADKVKALSDSVTEKQIENATRLRDLQKQLFEESFSSVKDIVSAQFDYQKNKVQDQIDKNEELKAAEIERINATSLSEEEKAARIQILNVRVQSQREALERRQRQIDQERARFEKAANIAKIIADTAVAIMNQLKTTPLPAGLPFIAAIGAIGALNLAKAIAQPIPKFKSGKNKDEYEGFGYVGDGGRKELIIREDGSIEVTPATPTITYLKSKDVVLPDAMAVLKDMEKLSYRDLRQMPQQKSSDTALSAYSKLTRQIVSAIESQPVPHIHNTYSGVQIGWKNGQRYWEWVNRNMQS